MFDGHDITLKKGSNRNPRKSMKTVPNIASDLDKCYTAGFVTAAAKNGL